MKLTLKSAEGDFVQVSLSGQVSQRILLPAEDSLARLLGLDCYRRRLLLDLSDVQVIDSSGVGWLLGCQKRFRAQGGQMVVHSFSPLVREILETLKMHLVLLMADDEQQARDLATKAK
ncbi:MAG: STAS domain-containing protein [Planctomycetota bacterium]|nr:STAS domain-containing protein [Planctomycetota bacterium]